MYETCVYTFASFVYMFATCVYTLGTYAGDFASISVSVDVPGRRASADNVLSLPYT